jgi:hypothetical protein
VASCGAVGLLTTAGTFKFKSSSFYGVCRAVIVIVRVIVHGWYMYVHQDETRTMPRHLMLDRVYADCPSRPDANSAKQPKRYVVIGSAKHTTVRLNAQDIRG